MCVWGAVVAGRGRAGREVMCLLEWSARVVESRAEKSGHGGRAGQKSS